MSVLVHLDQHVRNATQNSLCRAVNRRRGCCACRASNCRRRARFSRTRSSRERKTLTNQPRKCRSDTIMVRILAEKSESSSSPSHSFCRCTTFWRSTGVDHICGVHVREPNGEIKEEFTSGLFVFIGAKPRTDFLPSSIVRNDQGFVLTGQEVAVLPEAAMHSRDQPAWRVRRRRLPQRQSQARRLCDRRRRNGCNVSPQVPR